MHVHVHVRAFKNMLQTGNMIEIDIKGKHRKER